MEQQPAGLILIDKPLEWTSFDVVKKLRYVSRAKKIGHAGTLDPLATGLLILCFGKFTKRIEEIQGQEKEYEGTFTLGATTPSFDLETEIDKRFDISELTKEQVKNVVGNFIGEIEQYPPIHSAVKIEGKRAYKYARKGQEVKVRLRKVMVKSFELTRIELPEVDFKIVCSKGTYIRSLANDFGRALNNGAHLSRLRRTRIGKFDVKDAYQTTISKEEFYLNAISEI